MNIERWAMLASFSPYSALAAYDGWLHKKARHVPFTEQIFHAIATLSLAILLWGLFASPTRITTVALISFTCAACINELRFHKPLHRRERRLHFWAYAFFAFFVAVSWSVGSFT
jgi:hypothetical protein